MTKQEQEIIQWLEARADEATAPFEERIKEFRDRIIECDSIIDSLPEYKQYILDGGTEYHSLKKRCDIAQEDREIFMDIITDFDKEIDTIRQEIKKHKQAIISNINYTLVAKQSLLEYQATGADPVRHEKAFHNQLNSLLKKMEEADIPPVLAGNLRDLILQTPNYDLKEAV